MPNYNEMPKPQLLKACEEKGIKTTTKMRKTDLVALLENSEAASEKKPEAKGEEAKNERPKKTARKSSDTIIPNGNEKRVSLKGKKVYRSDGDLTVNSEDKFTEELSPEKKDDIELKLSQKNKIIQTGTIYHITEPKEINGVVTALAQVEKRVRKVIIPVQTLFDNYDEIVASCEDPEGNIDKKALAGKFALFLRSRLGSEVDYIVTNSTDDGDDIMYLGSRTAAMAKKREDYWFSHQKETDENGNLKYRINVGDRPEGRIVSVTKKAIIVEIFGVECKIPAVDVDYVFHNDLRKPEGPYEPGMKEKVVITDIIRDGANRTVKIKGSIKLGKPNPQAIYFDRYNKNDLCRGQISEIGINDSSVYFFVVLHDGVTVRCFLDDGIDKIPEKGDTVDVRINGKDDRTLFIWGRIKHIV